MPNVFDRSVQFEHIEILGDGKVEWKKVSAAGKYLMEMRVLGDSYPRFRIGADGRLEWGTGAAVPDTSLRRSSVDTLYTVDDFRIDNQTLRIRGGILTDDVLVIRATGDTIERLVSERSGLIKWGPGNAAQDVQMYRSGASFLRVASNFEIYQRYLNFSQTSPSSNVLTTAVTGDSQYRLKIAANGMYQIGGGAAVVDCEIARNAANELRTPDQFTALGGLATLVKAGIPVDGDFPTAIDGLIALDSTNNRAYFRLGGVWKYAALT